METESISATSDICKQLLSRYAHSKAAQHQHLCATAAATRSIISSSSLPLTPVSYFAATITSLSNYNSLDSNALSALTSFLSIVLPLVGRGEIKPNKANEAVKVLVRVVDECGIKLGTSSVRAVVKSVGVLVSEFCDSEDWDSLSLGFQWILNYSIDKRPKVRKCAQDCLMTVFKSFGSSTVTKKASKLIYSLLKDHIPVVMEMNALEIVDSSESEVVSRPEHQEVLHLINVLKVVVPYLSVTFRKKTLSQLLAISSSRFSAVTKHIIEVISVIVETSKSQVIVSNAEGIFKLLSSYMSSREKNQSDTVLFAASIAKTALGKIDGDSYEWANNFALLTESLAGLLSSESDTALRASKVFRELIDHHIDRNSLLNIKSQDIDEEENHNAEATAVVNTCNALYSVLNLSQISNEHLMSIVDFLFLKLGDISHIFMRGILLKLADLMNAAITSGSETKHLRSCIGSAVGAMGPEKLFELLPISFIASDSSCSNTWLIPILKENVVGSSLRFFIEHIVPLAESFDRASHKVIDQDLQACSQECWGLLPAFCRQPSDAYESFAVLSQLLLPFLKKDSFMLENIAIGLQALVNENRSALVGSEDVMEVRGTQAADEFEPNLEPKKAESNKNTRINMKSLVTCFKDLLQSLNQVFLESPPETRKYLKGAIECMASVCDPLVTKQIFVSSLKKFQLLDETDEHEKVKPETNSSFNEDETSEVSLGADDKRSIMLDLASCIVGGSDDDLVNILFCVIKHALQDNDATSQIQACQTLSKILENHAWFCSSQFDVVMDLLNGLKSSVTIELLKKRFLCLQALLIHAMMENLDEENTKSFLVLNEIILALKDSNEEGRKAAYDALNGLSSKLRKSSDAICNGSYQKLLTMFVGYLSGSSPQIKSGVVSALSVLIYNDPQICIKMPDIVPAVMELLHSKVIEVIKAVLGFVKVLVSCLESFDLQQFLSGIMDGVLRWSSVSRHHFKEKITVILEIMIRKCGTATVKGLAPEKYKDFVLDVVANRHGKTSSKETGSGDTKQVPDLSSKGNNKRKSDEREISVPEERTARPWKRNMGKRQNVVKSSESVGRSDHGGIKRKREYSNARGFKKDHSGGNKPKERTEKKNNNEGNNRRPDHSGGNKPKERTEEKRNNEGNNRRPAAASKFLSKHKKAGNKRKNG